jgi:uncharacterized protein
VLLENTLEIPAPIDRVWDLMLDVERVAPCMPGAELTEIVDERTWKGRVAVKLGPVSLSFSGTVAMQERDDADHTVVLKADGRETKGKGSASATVTSRLEADGDVTRVAITSDVTISGPLAQFGRGMIADVSQRMANQFAACLAAQVSAPAGGAPALLSAEPARPVAEATKPVGGIRLALWALGRAIARLIRRLFGRRS